VKATACSVPKLRKFTEDGGDLQRSDFCLVSAERHLLHASTVCRKDGDGFRIHCANFRIWTLSKWQNRAKPTRSLSFQLALRRRTRHRGAPISSTAPACCPPLPPFLPKGPFSLHEAPAVSRILCEKSPHFGLKNLSLATFGPQKSYIGHLLCPMAKKRIFGPFPFFFFGSPARFQVGCALFLA
jgi:hypothetical protein